MTKLILKLLFVYFPLWCVAVLALAAFGLISVDHAFEFTLHWPLLVVEIAFTIFFWPTLIILGIGFFILHSWASAQADKAK